MGGSSSKSTTTNKTDISVVNNSDLQLLNKNVNNFIANTVINQASNCSANISQLQNINFKNINTPGAFVVNGLTQNQSAALTFDCVQLSAFQNDIANGVLTQYTDAIKNSYDTSAIASMTAAAKATAKTQFASTGNAKSSSNSNNDYKFKSTTNVNQDIQNIVENAITNNMSLTDMQDCMSSVKNSQNINFQNINAGSVEVRALSQTQAAELYGKCMQEKNNANKISNQIVIDLGLDVSTEATTTSAINQETIATSDATNTGVLQSAGEGIASIYKGIGNMFGSIIKSFGFGGGGSDMSLYCCIAIVVLAILGGGYYFYQQQQSQNTGDDVDVDDMTGGAFVKFDLLKFIVLIMVFVLIIQIYTKQN